MDPNDKKLAIYCLPSFKINLPVENIPEVNAVKGPVSQSNCGKWNTTIRSSLSAASPQH